MKFPAALIASVAASLGAVAALPHPLAQRVALSLMLLGSSNYSPVVRAKSLGKPFFRGDAQHGVNDEDLSHVEGDAGVRSFKAPLSGSGSSKASSTGFTTEADSPNPSPTIVRVKSATFHPSTDAPSGVSPGTSQNPTPVGGTGKPSTPDPTTRPPTPPPTPRPTPQPAGGTARPSTPDPTTRPPRTGNPTAVGTTVATTTPLWPTHKPTPFYGDTTCNPDGGDMCNDICFYFENDCGNICALNDDCMELCDAMPNEGCTDIPESVPGPPDSVPNGPVSPVVCNPDIGEYCGEICADLYDNCDNICESDTTEECMNICGSAYEAQCISSTATE